MGHNGSIQPMLKRPFGTISLGPVVGAQSWGKEHPFIYPVLACHQGYNDDTSDPENGEGWLLAQTEECTWAESQHEDRCFKRCIYERLGVLEKGSFELTDEAEMTELLNSLIFSKAKTETGENLARRITSECRDELAAVAGKSCQAQQQFYNCVEHAIACCQSPVTWSIDSKSCDVTSTNTFVCPDNKFYGFLQQNHPQVPTIYNEK